MMRIGTMKRNTMAGIPVLIVFAVFAVSVLTVLLTGADLVREVTLRDSRSYDERTAGQYLTTRVRQADRTGAVSVSDDGALILTDSGREIGQKIYARHTLLTDLLIKMGVSPETAAADACKLEHAISDESFEAIQRYADRIK